MTVSRKGVEPFIRASEAQRQNPLAGTKQSLVSELNTHLHFTRVAFYRCTNEAIVGVAGFEPATSTV